MITPKAAAIPSTQGIDAPTRKVIEPLIEVVETITGRRPKVAKVAALPKNATLSEVIAKVNEIADRLQV
jgi:hypothetical protein